MSQEPPKKKINGNGRKTPADASPHYSMLQDSHSTEPLMGVWSPEIKEDITRLIEKIAPEHHFEHADVVTEIIITALKAVQAQLGRGDLKLLSRALRELRYAFKIFKDYRGIRKVTIFGSARSTPADPNYKIAKQFAQKLAQNGYMVITGAGPGIMMAGNEGAGPGGSFGVNIRLPYEQMPNEFIAKQPTYIDCRYFFTRKLIFVKEASAAAFFPGGYGTLDETFEILTLVQTGKCDPMPVLFIEKPGGTYWQGLKRYVQSKLHGQKRISPEDMHIFKIVHSADEAWDEISHFYANYHSLRYVGEALVVRLQSSLDDAQIKYLNQHFKDLLASGQFEKSGPLSEEDNQPELQHLPRLVFKFNRINNGRLRQLIDELNKLVWTPKESPLP
ncbi:MAG: LOG family protein [Elusimicrobia bacterium]|nr:LOG family protein [Candidatus Obscuribacterium magneticum]